MSDFYVDTLKRLLAQKVLRPDMKLLVTCAGEYDKNVLSQCGFTDAVLSNLDGRMIGPEIAPFSWAARTPRISLSMTTSSISASPIPG